jgi:hypothetical protein
LLDDCAIAWWRSLSGVPAEEAPIHERLEGGAERVPGIDRGIEAGLAKLDVLPPISPTAALSRHSLISISTT